MVTIQKVKNAAMMLDYGNNANAGQITDDMIQGLIEEVSGYVDSWLNTLKVRSLNSDLIDRYVELEVIIRLCLSYYNDKNGGYIEALKVERDRYKDVMERDVRRFASSNSFIKAPRLRGGVFE